MSILKSVPWRTKMPACVEVSRCERCCRLVECNFGRLKSKFKILHCNVHYKDREWFPLLIDVLLGLFNFISREEGVEEIQDDKLDIWRRDWRTIIPDNELRGAARAPDYDRNGQTVRKRLAKHVQEAKGMDNDMLAHWCFWSWPMAELQAEDIAIAAHE
jgi:hypothetical protein